MHACQPEQNSKLKTEKKIKIFYKQKSVEA